MISEFVREQKRYTKEELCKIFKCSEKDVFLFIRKLKEYGVLKIVKSSSVQKDMSDLLEEDIEISEMGFGEQGHLYVFTFVGVIVIAGRVLKCYPKYLLHTEEPKKELCQVIKVLEKYNSKEQIIHMASGSDNNSFYNLLDILLFLMEDYYENGIYTKLEKYVESNGEGEILWDKTMNSTFAIISDNTPYYIDLITRKQINNEYDYFKRLHKCILTKVSKELYDADLLDIFNYTEVDLSDEEIDDFGEKEYILYRLECELNNQYNTRKQLLLKIIYAYIESSGSFYNMDCISLFGTNSFNLVWENVCADILDNQLKKRLDMLKLPVSLKEEYDKDATLMELIEKPLWTITEKTVNDTLRPDLVTISKTKDGLDFIIFDAKYYNAKLEKGVEPKGQPGIESVIKQYMYQLAYQKFIKDHAFRSIKNCFLLPTEEDGIIDKGEVSMVMLKSLGLENIKVKFLSAKLAYSYYLSGRKLDIEKLEL